METNLAWHKGTKLRCFVNNGEVMTLLLPRRASRDGVHQAYIPIPSVLDFVGWKGMLSPCCP
jgi:hypothetical protein